MNTPSDSIFDERIGFHFFGIPPNSALSLIDMAYGLDFDELPDDDLQAIERACAAIISTAHLEPEGYTRHERLPHWEGAPGTKEGRYGPEIPYDGWGVTVPEYA